MGDIRIFFIPRAFVVLRTMCLPISEAHPAKVVLAVEALHVITATVLLDADVTLGTILRVSAYVIGRFAIVRTFR